MDRRLKIMTIAISIVYVACIGGYIYDGGIKIKFGAGQESVETGEKQSLSIIRYYCIFLKPENALHTFPTTMSNQLDKGPMKAEIETMAVLMSGVKQPMGAFVVEVCTYLLMLFVMIMVPFQTFKVVRSVTKDKIFAPSNICKLRFIGYALLAYYAANLVLNLMKYRIAVNVIQVDGYSPQMHWESVTFVLLGLVVLMFAEVLKISVQMKEEQDLTV